MEYAEIGNRRLRTELFRHEFERKFMGINSMEETDGWFLNDGSVVGRNGKAKRRRLEVWPRKLLVYPNKVKFYHKKIILF